MLLQISVVFRISLEFTCIFGCLMDFIPFSQEAHFSPSFFMQRKKGKKGRKWKNREGKSPTSGAPKVNTMMIEPKIKAYQ